MLDKVRALTNSASTTRTDSTALGASNILIHHSRDTESKQWAETSVQTLAGVVKIFNAQRTFLLPLGLPSFFVIVYQGSKKKKFFLHRWHALISINQNFYMLFR